MAQFTAGPKDFPRSISRSNLAEGNLSQYSRRNSDNASDPGGSSTNVVGNAQHSKSIQGGQ